MSSKGRSGSPAGQRPGQRPASRAAGGKPPAPPPPSVSNSTALPALPGSASKRFDWIDSNLDGDGAGGIKAARPASRNAAATAAAASGRGSPDFWARSSAPQLLDASVKHPELKLQLLARALEESRAKVAQLQQDKAAVADALLQLCEAAATDGGSGGGGGDELGAGLDSVQQAAGIGGDEDALPRQLDLLSTRLGALREALAFQTVAAAEAAAAHERAALQLVAQRQQREALERQLEEARYAAVQHEQAQHAAALKVALLEEQAAAAAESARKRMQEQLDTFRGDAATARSLRTRFTELEQQLDAARKAQAAEADRCRQLDAACERLQGRLKEATAKQAELSQQLCNKTAAHSDLSEQHHSLQEASRALASDNEQLRAALAAAQQRAQQAETLGAGLQAECAASGQLQAALQEDASGLKTELQQEREQAHRLQVALAEERAAGARQRAALQGGQEELASLLSKLEEYSNRIVHAEGDLEAARAAAQQAAAGQAAAEGAAAAARHENACLHDSLAELAAAEAGWRQQAEEAQERLAAAGIEVEASRWKARQQEKEAAANREQFQQLQATVKEQAGQLEALEGLRQQAERQQRQVAGLTADLQAAAARQAAVQAEADSLAAAKREVERSLAKQTVLARRLQEQSADLAAQLAAAKKEAAAATAQAEATAAEAAARQEEHAAAMASQQAAHEQRRVRNEQLEHENRQQAIVIAELEGRNVSLVARMEATQQQNAALHRYAVANGAAYGRLAAHAAGLHEQLTCQLGGLLSLCRHLSMQLGVALSAADPLAPLLAACGSGEADSAAGSPRAAAAASPEASSASASAVAAAMLSIQRLQIELQVAVRLLEMQAGGSEAAQLAAVPAGIAEALAADLAGLPASLLTSPRLAPADQMLGTSGRVAAVAQQRGTSLPLGAADGPFQQPQGEPQQPAEEEPPQVQQQQQPSVLSAQVARMEAHLERLVRTSAEQAARAAAATQLHSREQELRQRAEDLAARLAAHLAATQADLASTRQQRDELDAQSRRLAGELRDAIYSLSQMVAAQQGQVVSWAVRGLTSTAVQTQHCELWEAAVRFGGSSGGSVGSATACSPGNAALAGGASGDGSVLCAPEQSAASAASGADDGEEPPAEPAAGAAPRVLQLAALQQQIRALYRAKALHDIAVARGQRPFMPLPDFVAAHLTLQSGVDGPAVQQRAAQLQASVEAHAAADRDVTLFGLAAGMLEEVEAGGDAGSSAGASTSSCAVVVQPGGSAASASAAAAAVPLVLYHSRRCVSTSAAQQAADTLPTLRRFCAASWHAAYLRSAARSALARPFDPAGPAQLLHPMAAEVHNLAVAVPGVEQLMCWVLQGGLGACLGALDLGLRLAESQMPQLYLLAVEGCRLLGLATTPALYIKSSPEAAAYYLLLPQSTRLHGLNGSVPPQPTGGQVAAGGGSVSSRAGGGGGGSGKAAAKPLQPGEAEGLELLLPSSSCAAAEGSSAGLVAGAAQEWQCALVLTSGLVDLLEPEELQAVMAGCLGFHAALTCPAASGAGPSAVPEAAQLAVLCRSMVALASLGALAALAPEALVQRLPHAMAPFFFSRVQPVLRRALRYLALCSDRVAASVAGSWRPVAAAIVKQAAGSAVLRNELNLDAVLAQAAALDEAAGELLPAALAREEPATMAGAGASLAMLRVRELQKWAAGQLPGQ